MCGGRERELAHEVSLSRAGTHTARSQRERDLARAHVRETQERGERDCVMQTHMRARAFFQYMHTCMRMHACARTRETHKRECVSA